VVDGHLATRFLESNLTHSAGERTITGQRVSYTRVSTLDQNTARQLDGTAVDKTSTDKASGKDVNRPQLVAMLAFVREVGLVSEETAQYVWCCGGRQPKPITVALIG
jgi:hypothetical protein